MSAKSQLLRSVYSVPPSAGRFERPYERQWAKRRFWQKERDSRGDVQRRAAAILVREIERKENR